MWFNSDNPGLDSLLNTVFLLISSIKSKWNERHYQLYWDYLELGTYKKVSEKQNVTPQAICDTLKNNRAIDVIEAEKNVSEVLQHFQLDYIPAL